MKQFTVKMGILVLLTFWLGSGCSGGAESPNPVPDTTGTDSDFATDLNKDPGSDAGSDTGSPPKAPDYIDVETDWLAIPYDNPIDARTVLAVFGLRDLQPDGKSALVLTFGPSYNAYFEDSQGFNIYSPDDGNYAYKSFVEPLSITSQDGPDVVAALGEQAALIDRTTVRLELPTPMVEGATYYVRAIGGSRNEEGFDPATMHQVPWTGYPLTAGVNAKHFTYGSQSASLVTDTVVSQVFGLRGVQQVAPNILRVVLGSATVQSELVEPINFSLIRGEDTVQPMAIGLRSIPEVFLPGGPWPFPDKFFRYEVYLTLEAPLAADAEFTLELAEGTTSGRASLTFSSKGLHNPHLKVNQEGYLPESTEKRAWYGAWMGTGGSLEVNPDLKCRVHKADTDEVVFEASLDFRYDANTSIEGNYKTNESQENLYTCDFSSVTTEGSYYVSLDGAGRSYPFRIAKDVFERAFAVSMRGLLIQRSNDDFVGTDSHYIKTDGHGEDVTIPYMADGPVIGGHYDAGDYNPRVRWQVARNLMLAYEAFPEKFSDSQLDIPESANGIPDILDEVAWSLKPFSYLQDTDGGLGGTQGMLVESHADPNFVETIERDPWKQHSYEKETFSTLIFAALAAQASRIWEKLGQSETAAHYLDGAIQAYQWAESNKPTDSPWAYAWAAAELANTTGDASYLEGYTASGYTFSGVDDDHAGIWAAMAYARLPAALADASLQNSIKSNIESMAANWTEKGDSFAYPIIRHPWSPTTWGQGAYPNQIEPAMMAHALAKSPETRDRLHRAINLTLGVNPLNQSWLTGLGDNPIVGPTHLYGWSTYQGLMPPGLHSEGPHHSPPENWFPDNTPSVLDTPTMYNYYDVRYCIGLNEGVVTSQAMTAMTLSVLLPDRQP
jgi:hypothetical protein